MSDPRVLIVEDDPTLAMGLELNLAAEGFAVTTARDGVQGLRLARERRFDLLVLDLMLPGIDGLTLLQRLRETDRELPVLVLTARTEVGDKVDGLSRGADDYLTKPFSIEELAARLHALLRRSRLRRRQQELVSFGRVEVDLGARIVRREGRPIELTPREFDLLGYLLRHAGRTHSRQRLLVAVWGDDYQGTARTVDNFIRNLRVKLEREPARPRHLVTVRGAGYRFDR